MTKCKDKRNITITWAGDGSHYAFITKVDNVKVDPPQAIGSNLPESRHPDKTKLIKKCGKCVGKPGQRCDLNINTYNNLDPQEP